MTFSKQDIPGWLDVFEELKPIRADEWHEALEEHNERSCHLQLQYL